MAITVYRYCARCGAQLSPCPPRGTGALPCICGTARDLLQTPELPTAEDAAIGRERDRVLDAVIGLVERGGNPGEIGVLCDELKEGIEV